MRLLVLISYLTATVCCALSTSNAPPRLAIPLSAQLNASHPLAVLSGAFPLPPDFESDIPTLRIPHAWSFSIGWLAGTFSDPESSSDDLVYWGTQGNNQSNLPDWLQFDNETLTFFGVSPSQSTIEQNYLKDNITITLNSAFGLGDTASVASASFVLQTSDSELVISTPPPLIQTTAYQNIASDLRAWLSRSISFTRGNISSEYLQVIVDTTRESWLSWDSVSLQLYGRASENDVHGRTIYLPLTIVDNGEKSMEATTLQVDILPYPFAHSTLPNVSVSLGETFAFTFTNCTNANASEVIDYALSVPDLDWLHVDQAGLSIRGTVPLQPMNLGPLNLTIIATTSTNFTISSTFYMHIAQADHSSTTVPSFRQKIHIWITLLIILPLIVTGSCVFFCWRYRLRRHVTKTTDGIEAVLPLPSISYDDPKPVDESLFRGSYISSLGPEASIHERTSFETKPSVGASSLLSFSIRHVDSPNMSRPRSVLDISPTFTLPIVAEGDELPSNLKTAPSTSMAQMPSMNFGFLLSPDPNMHTPKSASVKCSTRSEDDLAASQARLGAHNTSPLSTEVRSVNSAYDSLPSWDSESTWHYERRRRPPSPAWRRDDVERKVTLWDKMREEAKEGVKLGHQ